MAVTQLVNYAESSGFILGNLTGLSDSVIVNMVDGLTMTKTANPTTWASGNLTYAITITNVSGEIYETVTVTDQIDAERVILVENSVMMNGSPVNYTYSEATGVLNIVPVPDVDVEDGSSIVFTFQVERIVP